MKTPHHPSHDDNRSRRIFATSISAVAWASMLVGLSGVSAFSPNGIPFTQKIPNSSYCCTDSTHPARCRTSTTSTRIEAFLSQIKRSSIQVPSTRLQYRRGDGENNERRQEYDSTASRLADMTNWVGSMFSQNSLIKDMSSQQEEVDQYLEFLDRRYNRLHTNENDAEKSPPFSVLNWLAEGDKNIIGHPGSASQEDALYVLGVAGLASEHLLQKHHLPTEHVATSSNTGAFIDAKSVPFIEKLPIHPVIAQYLGVFTPMLQAGKAVLSRVRSRRKAWLAYRNMKLRTWLKFALNAPAKIPRAVASLWKMSGGRSTMALTVSVAATLLFILRPIIQGELRNTLNV